MVWCRRGRSTSGMSSADWKRRRTGTASGEFTIVFYDSEQIQPMRVAFVVDDDAFDAILRRLQSQGVAYGSQPNDPTNGRIDHPLSERGLFFQIPDGHLFELMASCSGEA